ncbi:uncharacterized protein LOC143446138 isoform X1 [Clavelina lepadiformis]|uniref:uncharacterized protein LOC143446138 isoform X1 n=1 Tax=Clavelina lepadiformis TaxID=159417 RepID=UPI0040421A9B
MQTPEGCSGIEVHFNPPGCDPFYVPASPKSHYHPTSLQSPHREVRQNILTPEKCHKPEVKDNSSYTPLQYSFCEEEKPKESNFCGKQELDSILDKWTSDKFKEVWPSSNGDNSDLGIGDSSQSVYNRQGPNFEQESIKLSKDILDFASLSIPATPKPQMASTQSSNKPPSKNISSLVNRFRYGKPTSRNERKSQSSSDQSTSSKNQSGRIGWQSSKTAQSKHVAKSISKKTDQGKRPEESSQHNNSITELQRRVERILSDSAFSTTTQPSRNSLVSSSTFSNNDFNVKSTSVFNVSPSSFNTTKSCSIGKKEEERTPTSVNNPQSSSSSDASSIRLSSGKLKGKSISEEETPTKYPSIPESMSSYDCVMYPIQSPGIDYQFRREAPPLSPKRNNPPDDILQQWRLRRRMEAAQSSRDNIFRNYAGTHGVSKPTLPAIHFAPAERPLVSEHMTCAAQTNPSKEVRSVGVAVTPTTCAETQTSPPPSPYFDDLLKHVPPSLCGKSLQKISDVSMHKVTVVNGEKVGPSTKSDKAVMPLSPSSVKSQLTNTDTWTDMSLNSKSSNASWQRVGKEKAVPGETVAASPTTTVVKKIVGTRLFEPSSVGTDTLESTHTVEEPLSSNKDSSISSHGNIGGGESPKLISPRETADLLDPSQLLQDLLGSIDQEENDYENDPVLKSLRQRRNEIILKLKEVDQKLEDSI